MERLIFNHKRKVFSSLQSERCVISFLDMMKSSEMRSCSLNFSLSHSQQNKKHTQDEHLLIYFFIEIPVFCYNVLHALAMRLWCGTSFGYIVITSILNFLDDNNHSLRKKNKK